MIAPREAAVADRVEHLLDVLLAEVEVRPVGAQAVVDAGRRPLGADHRRACGSPSSDRGTAPRPGSRDWTWRAGFPASRRRTAARRRPAGPSSSGRASPRGIYRPACVPIDAGRAQRGRGARGLPQRASSVAGASEARAPCRRPQREKTTTTADRAMTPSSRIRISDTTRRCSRSGSSPTAAASARPRLSRIVCAETTRSCSATNATASGSSA